MFWGLYVTAASIRLIQTSQEQLTESEERWIRSCFINYNVQGFPGGAVVENLPANAGDTGSSPGLGGSHMLRSD